MRAGVFSQALRAFGTGVETVMSQAATSGINVNDDRKFQMASPHGIPPYHEDKRRPETKSAFSVMPLLTLLVIGAGAYFGVELLLS